MFRLASPQRIPGGQLSACEPNVLVRAVSLCPSPDERDQSRPGISEVQIRVSPCVDHGLLLALRTFMFAWGLHSQQDAPPSPVIVFRAVALVCEFGRGAVMSVVTGDDPIVMRGLLYTSRDAEQDSLTETRKPL